MGAKEKTVRKGKIMDEQKPIWRTAWYLKRAGLFLFVPLFAVWGILELLKAHRYLTSLEFDRMTTILYPLCSVVFTIWIDLQTQKRNHSTNQIRKQ